MRRRARQSHTANRAISPSRLHALASALPPGTDALRWRRRSKDAEPRKTVLALLTLRIAAAGFPAADRLRRGTARRTRTVRWEARRAFSPRRACGRIAASSLEMAADGRRV